jgi:hypothetical protein
MRFSLSFDMDGAAFDGCEESSIRRSAKDSSAVLGCGDNSVDEVVRILHNLADTLDLMGAYYDTDASLLDINGNTIGSWEVIDG